MSLPYDINRDESIDRGLAYKLVEVAALGVKHFAPGASVHSVAVHFQQVANGGKSDGTDKFRINLMVRHNGNWRLITLFGNCRYVDLKIRDQKDKPAGAYEFDQLYDAASDLDCEMRLTAQVKAAQKRVVENGAPYVRFMPEYSQLLALDLDAGTKKPLGTPVDSDNPFSAFAASLGPTSAPGNNSATLTPMTKPALPFGDW